MLFFFRNIGKRKKCRVIVSSLENSYREPGRSRNHDFFRGSLECHKSLLHTYCACDRLTFVGISGGLVGKSGQLFNLLLKCNNWYPNARSSGYSWPFELRRYKYGYEKGSVCWCGSSCHMRIQSTTTLWMTTHHSHSKIHIPILL